MKKSVRSALLLAVSGVLGIGVINLIKGMTPTPQTVSATVETKKVVVAATALTWGDRIAPSNLRAVDFLSGSVPDGSFTSVADLTTGEPRVALATIEAGEPVLASRVSGSGGKASLSTVIDATKRAVSIRVDDVSGAAGFITPSDRVDVMLTRSEQSGTPQTEILLQNIRVLGIDQRANEHEDKPSVARAVTVEVTPEEAQKIALAQKVGSLSLSLRNMGNAAAVPNRAISTRDLTSAPPVKEAPITHRTIQVIRGSAGTNYEVQDGSIKALSTPSAPTPTGQENGKTIASKS